MMPPRIPKSRTTKPTFANHRVGALPDLNPSDVDLFLMQQRSSSREVILKNLNEMSQPFSLRYFSSIFTFMLPTVIEMAQELRLPDLSYLPDILKEMRDGEVSDVMIARNESVSSKLRNSYTMMAGTKGARWYFIYQYVDALDEAIRTAQPEEEKNTLLNSLSSVLLSRVVLLGWSPKQRECSAAWLTDEIRLLGYEGDEALVAPQWKKFLLLLQEQVLMTAREVSYSFDRELPDLVSTEKEWIPLATVIRADAYRQLLRLKDVLIEMRNSPRMEKIVGGLEAAFREMTSGDYFLWYWQSEKKTNRVTDSAMGNLIAARLQKNILIVWQRLQRTSYLTGESQLSEEKGERRLDVGQDKI